MNKARHIAWCRWYEQLGGGGGTAGPSCIDLTSTRTTVRCNENAQLGNSVLLEVRKSLVPSVSRNMSTAGLVVTTQVSG